MRTVSSLFLIAAIITGGILVWSTLGELLGSTQSAYSSLREVAGTRVPVAGTSLAGGSAAVTPVLDASPVAVRPTAAGTPIAPPVETPAPSPVATATAVPTAEATAQASPTPATDGRNPWVLLPGPEPGSRVTPGPVVLEARGRGDAPIREIRLELDGKALSASLEQRSESIWRAQASANVAPGTHQARAVVVDADGRSGAYRWSFEAAR